MNREKLYEDRTPTYLYREDMMTMVGKEHVMISVIDAWSCILNEEGKHHPNKRFFFTPNAFVSILQTVYINIAYTCP